jgi:hypothetical protein
VFAIFCSFRLVLIVWHALLTGYGVGGTRPVKRNLRLVWRVVSMGERRWSKQANSICHFTKSRESSYES